MWLLTAKRMTLTIRPCPASPCEFVRCWRAGFHGTQPLQSAVAAAHNAQAKRYIIDDGRGGLYCMAQLLPALYRMPDLMSEAFHEKPIWATSGVYRATTHPATSKSRKRQSIKHVAFGSASRSKRAPPRARSGRSASAGSQGARPGARERDDIRRHARQLLAATLKRCQQESQGEHKAGDWSQPNLVSPQAIPPAVLSERSLDQPQRLRVHFDSAHKTPPAAAGSEGAGHNAGRDKLQPPGPAGADDIPKA
jgi:hypothetical protein